MLIKAIAAGWTVLKELCERGTTDPIRLQFALKKKGPVVEMKE
jgi:hypothetical protein